MAKALQRRRGTHEEHQNFTGLVGEFTYDTTEKRIVAHDGATKGGIPLAKKAELESTKAELEGKIEQVSSSLDPRILDAASQSDILEAVSQATVGNVDAPTLEGLQAQIAANASNIETKLPNTTVHVVESWSATNGSSWYKKYSDGTVYQGGVYDHGSEVSDLSGVVITFPIPFADASYTLGALAYRNNGNKSYRQQMATVYAFTEMNFTGGWYGSSAVSRYLSWEAKGRY